MTGPRFTSRRLMPLVAVAAFASWGWIFPVRIGSLVISIAASVVAIAFFSPIALFVAWVASPVADRAAPVALAWPATPESEEAR